MQRGQICRYPQGTYPQGKLTWLFTLTFMQPGPDTWATLAPPSCCGALEKHTRAAFYLHCRKLSEQVVSADANALRARVNVSRSE
jgi:hypothetical protein